MCAQVKVSTESCTGVSFRPEMRKLISINKLCEIAGNMSAIQGELTQESLAQAT